MRQPVKQEKKPTAVRAAKRGIWYFMRVILIVALIALACYGVFTTAFRAANMYILVTEGLQLRAECIVADGPKEELKAYFTEAFLSRDTLLTDTPYDDYNITSYDYRVEVNGFSVWPWSKTASFTVTSRMSSMSGVIREDRIPENAPEDAVYPLPEWEDGRYEVRFRLDNGRWYMYQMQLVDAAPTPVPLRTPDMNKTPVPMPTATP